jgi:hypothetical protein
LSHFCDHRKQKDKEKGWEVLFLFGIQILLMISVLGLNNGTADPFNSSLDTGDQEWWLEMSSFLISLPCLQRTG